MLVGTDNPREPATVAVLNEEREMFWFRFKWAHRGGRTFSVSDITVKPTSEGDQRFARSVSLGGRHEPVLMAGGGAGGS